MAFFILIVIILQCVILDKLGKLTDKISKLERKR